VVHRDIKPANIMVGYNGSVKVADFGLAKSVHQQNSSLTLSGHVMGTLNFVAPEALTLGMGIDHRADIYAVGVMLYQMLTGKLPQGLFEMPSMQVPGLDPRYDAIVAGAMREDRDQRYQRILEMRHALDAILTQPVPRPEASQQALPRTVVSPVNRKQRPTGQPSRPAQRPIKPIDAKKKSQTGWLAVGVILALSGGCFYLLQQKPENPGIGPVSPGVADAQRVASPSEIQVKLPLVSHEVAARFPEGRSFESHWSAEKPADLSGLPDKLKSPLFNTHSFSATTGGGPQNYRFVLNDPNGSSPRLFVDSNGNGNFSDDPMAIWRSGNYRREAWIRSAVGQGTAIIKLKIGDETKEVGLIVYYSPSSRKNEFDSIVELDYARMGRIKVEGKSILAALSDCSSADFSAPNSSFCLDLNDDGFFSRKDEIFPVRETIRVGGQNFLLSDLDSSGADFQLVKAQK
jgi:serine/threonine protein kinase